MSLTPATDYWLTYPDELSLNTQFITKTQFSFPEKYSRKALNVNFVRSLNHNTLNFSNAQRSLGTSSDIIDIVPKSVKNLRNIFGNPRALPFRQNYRFNRFECKWEARFDRKISGTNGRPFRGIPLFLSKPVRTDIPVPFVQFCFDRRMGTVIFPTICCPFTHSRSFSFSFFSYLFVQNGICACTSDAKALGGFSRNTSRFLWQKQKPEFRYGTSTTREIAPAPPKKKKKLSANKWRWDANEALCLENLSTWRRMFPEFLPRNFV